MQDAVLDCFNISEDDGNYGRYLNNNIFLNSWFDPSSEPSEPSGSSGSSESSETSGSIGKHYTSHFQSEFHDQEKFQEYFGLLDKNERFVLCESRDYASCCKGHLLDRYHDRDCTIDRKYETTCRADIVTKTIVVTDYGRVISLVRFYRTEWQCQEIIKVNCWLSSDDIKELDAVIQNKDDCLFDFVVSWLTLTRQSRTSRKIIVSLVCNFLLPELVDIVCNYDGCIIN